MICPNCGTNINGNSKECKYCGANLEIDNLKKIFEENRPQEKEVTKVDSNAVSIGWVGPRRIAHVIAILTGIGMTYQGWMLHKTIDSISTVDSDMGAGVWCILYGVILIALGIIGLVKIYSTVCSFVLPILYVVALLPFILNESYRDVVMFYAPIFYGIVNSFLAIGVCGSAITVRRDSVAMGWIIFALFFVICIAINVNYEKIQTEFFNQMVNELSQNESHHENGGLAQVQATETPVPTEAPSSVYNGQDLLYSDYDEEESEDSEEEEDDDAYDDYEDDEGDSGYIFSGSDSEYLTKADVKGMSAKELNLAKNELYARHGRIFDREDLQEYFESCSWYEPLYTREEWDEKGDKYFFNEVEIKNRNFLVKRERKAKK